MLVVNNETIIAPKIILSTTPIKAQISAAWKNVFLLGLTLLPKAQTKSMIMLAMGITMTKILISQSPIFICGQESLL